MSGSNLMRAVTAAEKNDFHRDGAVLLKSMLHQDWTDVLEAGLEYTRTNPDGMSAGVDMPLRIDQFPASHSPMLAKLVHESPIAEIVGAVLDAPVRFYICLLYTSPSPRDATLSRMPSSA